MSDKLIDWALGQRVLMVGVYYKNHAPGGMAAVIQYYSRYMEGLRFVPSWHIGNAAVRAAYGFAAYLRVLCLLTFDKRIRILHIHTAADGSFWRKSVFVKLGKTFGKKVILHVHASRFKDFYNESSRKAHIVDNIRLADRLIVLSESWRAWFEGIGIEPEKIEVLHNITDYPTAYHRDRGDGRVHFLFLGEIGQRKGVFDILRGMAKHLKELDGKMLLRIGGNKNEEKLLAAIRDSGLEDMVAFEGWVSGEKKLNLLGWADVFILPSFNEGLPISILEAMSYGCPIISTPVGGIPEVVTDRVNGRLVTPGDDEEIIKAMLRYVRQPQTIITEGKESMERVKTYLPDYVMQSLKDIYTNLLD